MSNENTNFRELFTRSLAKVVELKSEIERLESAANAPIAVVGMACRFPGDSVDPEAYWRALEAGVDGIKRIPSTRWQVQDADPPAAKWAGLLDAIDGFDASFFRVSPREATVMDPQHRMFLELCWEALERAGQPVEALLGSATGVFFGMANYDYGMLSLQEPRPDVYVYLGAAPSTASGRVSNYFGFQGPSMTVDTACSSSLVAIHLACQSLRAGESNMALAGGINALASRAGIMGAATLQAMSPEGRCRTFDAEANGFVIGEGCGIVVLKRLADAVRDCDPILAVVRSTAVNQDGKTASMTVPNVLSQQSLLRRALKQAQLQPEDIGFVEAHGTATPLGDPIEFEALRAVFGKPREDGSTLPLGAAKTNLGHLSAAAGVAGFIKAVQCIRHQTIPPNLHFRTLNPRISLDGTPFVIPTEKSVWKSNGKPRRAGVSSFGMSGTNAHTIIEEAPLVPDEPVAPASQFVLPLSARSPKALVAMARAYHQWFAQNEEVPLHHIAYTASMRRSHLEHRLCAVGATKEDLVAALGAFVAGEPSAAITTGRAFGVVPRVVFVFPGQGAQSVGLSARFYEQEAAFRAALDACDEIIRAEAGFSVRDVLLAPAPTAEHEQIDVAQPVLFAIEVAFAALWRSRGVEPSCVVGHSMGEIAAAHIAGALSLRDAATIICRRSRLMRQVSGQGAMALVQLNPAETEKRLLAYENRLNIAACNSALSTVIAGDPKALDELLVQLEQEGIFCRRAHIKVASHSPQMDPLRNDLCAALADIAPQANNIPIRSTVTGERIRGEELTAAYWADNLRKPVLFSRAIEQCLAEGQTIYVEMGPHPVLATSMEESIRESKVAGVALASMRRGQDEQQTFLSSLATTYTLGYSIAWKSFFPNGGRVVSLPTYPWQHERYWLESSNLAEQQSFAPTNTSDELMYATVWQPAPARSDKRVPQAGICLVFMDESGAGAALVKTLESRNQTCVQIVPGKKYSARGSKIRIDPTNPDEYSRLLDDCLDKNTYPVRVVHLWNLDATPFNDTTADTLDADLLHGTLSVSFLTAALSDRKWSHAPRLCLVTRGAQAIGDGDKDISVAQGPVWGLGSSIVLSHADWETVLIDLPYAAMDGDIDTLTQEVLNDYEGQTQVAFRSSGRYAAQIVRKKQPSEKPAEIQFRSDATYLVTGGLGDLGREVARWMVEKGARNLVLVSRRAPNEKARQTIAAMEEKGARVLALCADIANLEDVERLLATILEKMPALRGIIHAAGLAPTIMETTRESMLAITAPKVRGAWNLHQATRDMSLDFFAMYSSASAFLGLLGGAEYCAGNAFLDTLAFARHSLGATALSVQWGAFGEVGQVVQVKGATSAYGALDPMMLDDAHRAFALVLAERSPVVSIMHFSMQRHGSLFPHLERNFFWSALQPSNASNGPVKPNRPTTNRRVVEKLLAATPETQNDRLTTYMQHALSLIVHLDPGRIALDASLHTLGMDSLMCLELRNLVENDLNVHLPIKDILGSNGIKGLCDLLGRHLWTDGAADIAPTNDKPGNWVVVPRPKPDATMRLICFPYAGGNASVFSPWVDLIGSKVELCAIQPPGRQERIREPLLETMEQMVEGIVPALLPYLDKPFAMFGHCVGAMVMYEVIRVLHAKHSIDPVHIFASGALPPKNYLIPAIDTSVDSDKFVETLRQIGFAEDSVLGDAESARELLPTVSGDFDLAIRYECQAPTPVHSPITTICGREDQFGPPERTVKWNELTTARFDQVVLPGEHYFLAPERTAVLRTVNEELDNYVAIFEQRREPSRWLQRNAPRNKAAMRLFCFPGVWENPAVFDEWSTLMGKDIDVCIIERPGYGESRSKTPLRRIDDMMEFLVPAIEPLLDRPFVFLGHDMGSILMFEVTRSFRRQGKPLPAHLVVAATNAPHLYWSGPTHTITKDRLLDGIRVMEVKLDDDLPDEVLMAEASMMATYMYTQEQLFDMPITAIIGKKDRFVPQGALRGWKGATTGPFDLNLIDAGHNVIVEKNQEVIDRAREVCQMQTIKKPAAAPDMTKAPGAKTAPKRATKRSP